MADYFELVASQAPLGYWAMDGAEADGLVVVTIDGTRAGVEPGMVLHPGVWATGEGSVLGRTNGFAGFDGSNRWYRFDGSAEAYLGELLRRVDGGVGGISDGAGTVSFWMASEGGEDATGAVVQHLFYGASEPGGDGFGTQDEMHVNLTVGGGLQFFSRQSDVGGVNRDVVTSASYTDGRWHHVVATWDVVVGRMVLYVDGGDAGGGETVGTDLAGTVERRELVSGLRFGRGLSSGRRFFRGRMDELAIWDRALGEAEVLAQFLAAKVGSGDLDGDGLPDVWEVANFGSVSAQDGDGDPDGDGVDNRGEQVFGTLPSVADTDGDGLPDGAEIKEVGSDPLVADTDGDGLDDGEEVERTGTSPVLADSDGDGMGDGYEDRWFGGQGQMAAGDFDADGATNREEYLAGSHPGDADTDGDGLTDGFELKVSGSNPLSGDSDADRLGDAVELTETLTDANVRDSDSDGFADGVEVSAGSDPNSGASVPAGFSGGGKWRCRVVKEDEVSGGVQLDTLPEAMVLVNPNITAGAGAAEVEVEEEWEWINHGGGGNFGGDGVFPTGGFSSGERFAVLVEGEIFVEEEGVYAFLLRADDGARLRIGGLEGTVVIEDPAGGGSGDRFGSVELGEGRHAVQVLYFQETGGAELELAVYRGRGEVGAFLAVADWELLQPMDATDADGDGMADLWENFYFGGTAGNAAVDRDADGLSDGSEFLAGTDPTVADGDGDGLGDREEVDEWGTDPSRGDTDGDGLGDAAEIGAGTDPLEQDSDGDGYFDGMEATGGTILWVTDGDRGAELEYTDDDPRYNDWINDEGFVRFLRENGFGVVVETGFSDGMGGPVDPVGVDVVMISRNTNSAGYDGFNAAWDALPVPVISLTPYVIRDSRMRWLDGGSNAVNEFGEAGMRIAAAADVAFEGLGLRDGLVVEPVRTAVSVTSGNVEIGNGELVGVSGTNGSELWMARWLGREPFYVGGEVPAAERVFLAMGTGGVNPTPGVFNLSGVGEAMLLNVVEDLVWRGRAGAAYLDWRGGYAALGGSAGRPEADVDGDGFTNLEEMAFGLNPTEADVWGEGDAPRVVVEGGRVSVELQIADERAVAVSGEVSSDLDGWGVVLPEVLGGGGYRIVVPEGEDLGYVRVRVTLR